ncbi:hypothetical protein ACFQ8C_31675 [Streptomyces sp. NPDC056503]|uniref:hypothetical protein n=1 Tax=Streptomyces sp. NPDC056503 TaxID=3345842 RepID=UPI00368E507B
MLAESLTALAAACGAGVVQAAGTDAWTGFRGRLARWLGRGDAERETVELERLDRTAALLTSGDDGAVEREQIRSEASWQSRIEALLESLDEEERPIAATELRSILGERNDVGSGVSASASAGGVAAQHLSNHAEGGSVVANVVQGGIHLGHPGPPDPSRG